MKKFLLSLLAFSWACGAAFAQSKVFKEVNDEIATQFATLTQEGAVIGYVAFTKLEKVSEDVYNYRISIMDENLNDIGTVNFQEKPLVLQGIAFEQDVICLAYFRSNMIDKYYKKVKHLDAAHSTFKSDAMVQFINLEGKIIETVTTPVDIKITNTLYTKGYGPKGNLKKHQLISVPQTGFAWMFEDNKKKQLSIYSPKGQQISQNLIKEEITPDVDMIASHGNLYLLTDGAVNKSIKSNKDPNAYVMLNYNIKENSVSRMNVKDKQGHQLSILTFGIDPASGNPYLSGFLRGKSSVANTSEPRAIAKGAYAGLFNVNFNGSTQKEVVEHFTYWDDRSKPEISHKGYFRDQRSYTRLHISFRDFQGNTYFAGDGVVKKIKVGSIVSSTILAPTVILPIWILGFGGTQKAKVGEPMLLKLDAKGALSWVNPVEGESYNYGRAFYFNDRRTYYTTSNQELKQQYLVVNEKKSSSIYNITGKKLVRKIPLTDQSMYRRVFPAKEGHVMISEYNSKEKYTRVSIEAL
jgi:hypothetical protein